MEMIALPFFSTKIINCNVTNVENKIISLYIGMSSCWMSESDSDVSINMSRRVDIDSDSTTDDLLKTLFTQEKHYSIRLLLHQPDFFYKIVRLTGNENREHLSAFFHFLSPPASIIKLPLRNDNSGDDYHLLAAVEVGVLKTILRSIPEAAFSIESFIPLPCIFLMALHQSLINSNIGILIPGFYCTSIVLGGKGRPSLVRSFLPGWRQVFEGLKDEGLSNQAALSLIFSKGIIGRSTAYSKVIDPFIYSINKSINETLIYYREQLGGEPLERIVLCGYEIAYGLFKEEVLDFDPVFYIAGKEFDSVPNLLKGTTEPLIKVSRVMYSYSTGKRQFEKIRAPMSMNKRGAYRQKYTLLDRLASSFMKSYDENTETDRLGAKSKREIFLMLMLVVIVMWFFLSQYTNLKKRYKMKVDHFYHIQEEFTLKGKHTQSSEGKYHVSNKIVWAEQMIALSEEIKHPLWLTDIYIEAIEEESQGGFLLHNILTVEGATLSLFENHISEVAGYMERLKRNKKFNENLTKLNVRDISLDERQGNIIRFIIEATYDHPQNKMNHKEDVFQRIL